MVRSRLLVVVVWVAFARGVSAANPPPPSCAGSEPYRFAVQGSTNNGTTWNTAYPYIYVYGSPGQTVYLKVRTLLTVTTGATDAWSFSLRHDPSYLRYYGGDMTLEGVTTSGTSTATVQSGGPPDFNPTQARSGFDGWTQAIVIDNSQEVSLPPTSNFVTAGACYKIRVPYYWSYSQSSVRFTNDVGTPAVDTIVSQAGESRLPCARNLTIYVYPYYSTPNSCSLTGGWLGSRESGPEETFDTPEEPEAPLDGDDPPPPPQALPFSCADANSDGTVNITDPVYLLNYLFLGTVDPPLVIVDLITKTGQTHCYDESQQIDCPADGQPFYGQDGSFQAGNGLFLPAGRFSGNPSTVTDSQTGLMWMQNAADYDGLNGITIADRVDWGDAPLVIAAVNARRYANFDDWRLPRMQELISIADYGRGLPALDTTFFGVPGGDLRFWTSEQMYGGWDPCEWPSGAYVNFSTGHLNTYGDDAWVRPCRDVRPLPHLGAMPAHAPFSYGDADRDGALNINDPVMILNWLFRGGDKPCNVVAPVTYVATPDQFIVAGQTVIDTRTGLQWYTVPDTVRYSWQDALALASNLNAEQHSDWRLPNVQEAASILQLPGGCDEQGQPLPTVVDDAFLDLFPAGAYWKFWLSDTSMDTDHQERAWTVNFLGGEVHDSYQTDNTKAWAHRFFAVRGGL